jgi:hypothetical protein
LTSVKVTKDSEASRAFWIVLVTASADWADSKLSSRAVFAMPMRISTVTASLLFMTRRRRRAERTGTRPHLDSTTPDRARDRAQALRRSLCANARVGASG